MAEKNWCVYIVRCSDGTLYTGITNNLQLRLKNHNCGKGCRYTRHRRPVTLVFSRTEKDKSSALKREAAIKALSRRAKNALIAGPTAPETESA